MRLLKATPFWRRGLRAAALRLFHAVENNGCAAVARNGERWLVRSLMDRWRLEPAARVVLDVGANEGDYAALVLAEAGRCGVDVAVHAVEPSGACLGRLRERFGGEPRVHLHAHAVSDTSGTMRLRSAAPGSPMASLVPRAGIPDTAGEEVAVSRLDELLERSGVRRVDLLKLDVEGAEPAALRGLGAWLGPERVAVIQFEYGGTTLDAGATLGGLFGVLRTAGYRVGKLFPRHVEIRDYRPWMEHFAYANFVAFAPEALEGRSP